MKSVCIAQGRARNYRSVGDLSAYRCERYALGCRGGIPLRVIVFASCPRRRRHHCQTPSRGTSVGFFPSCLPNHSSGENGDFVLAEYRPAVIAHRDCGALFVEGEHRPPREQRVIDRVLMNARSVRGSRPDGVIQYPPLNAWARFEAALRLPFALRQPFVVVGLHAPVRFVSTSSIFRWRSAFVVVGEPFEDVAHGLRVDAVELWSASWWCADCPAVRNSGLELGRCGFDSRRDLRLQIGAPPAEPVVPSVA